VLPYITRSSRFWVACGAAVLAVALHAERGVLVVNVTSPQGKPIPRVVFSTKGDGSVGPPTDDAGRTRIRLAAQTQPSAIVALSIVKAPKDLVFISPWDQQFLVPPFENESQNFAVVVLAERGDRDILVNSKGLVSLVSKLNLATGAKGAPEDSPRQRRVNALKEIADAFGLKPEEVDTAIREWGRRTTDPYEKGMAALYAENFPVAEESLAAALKIRIERVEREKRDAADAAFFLASAKYAQGKYGESADVYRQSLELRPDDPAAMNNLGLSLSHMGDYANAEPLLKRTRDLKSLS